MIVFVIVIISILYIPFIIVLVASQSWPSAIAKKVFSPLEVQSRVSRNRSELSLREERV